MGKTDTLKNLMVDYTTTPTTTTTNDEMNNSTENILGDYHCSPVVEKNSIKVNALFLCSDDSLIEYEDPALMLCSTGSSDYAEDEENDEESNEECSLDGTCVLSDGSSSGYKKRKVTFHTTVEIHEHKLTVGDHPSCTDDFPLSLDWEYDVVRKHIDEHSKERNSAYVFPTRLSFFERRSRLSTFCSVLPIRETKRDTYVGEVNELIKQLQESLTVSIETSPSDEYSLLPDVEPLPDDILDMPSLPEFHPLPDVSFISGDYIFYDHSDSEDSGNDSNRGKLDVIHKNKANNGAVPVIYWERIIHTTG